jgi:hypothetical protein
MRGGAPTGRVFLTLCRLEVSAQFTKLEGKRPQTASRAHPSMSPFGAREPR